MGVVCHQFATCGVEAPHGLVDPPFYPGPTLWRSPSEPMLAFLRSLSRRTLTVAAFEVPVAYRTVAERREIAEGFRAPGAACRNISPRI